MVTGRRGTVSEEKPDPIRRLLAEVGDTVEEPSEAALAKPVGGEAATGSPPAGRTTLEDARAQGGLALLQVLGPGLITGASDDDPSGIGTYSQAGSQFGLATLGWRCSPSL